jgi:biopolymer transport protein TolR
MAMSTTAGGGVKAEPNVTPMIDVMLVLLIIFMIIIPALNAGFDATPPLGRNLKAHPEDNADQVLGIDVHGNYFLNKKPIHNEDLPTLLGQIYAARTEDKIMYLKADRGLDYGKILTAIDIAAHNGVRVTGMITDQTPGTRSTVPGDNPMDTKGALPIGAGAAPAAAPAETPKTGGTP